jgi:hypothetical protein
MLLIVKLDIKDMLQLIERSRRIFCKKLSQTAFIYYQLSDTSIE